MGGRFNFPDELRKARRALEERVAEYAAEHPAMGYRELCEAFNLSLGTLSSIMRRRRQKAKTHPVPSLSCGTRTKGRSSQPS